MIFDRNNISTCNIKNDKLKVLGGMYNPRGASFLSLSPIYLLMNIFNLFFVCLEFVYSFTSGNVTLLFVYCNSCACLNN